LSYWVQVHGRRYERPAMVDFIVFLNDFTSHSMYRIRLHKRAGIVTLEEWPNLQVQLALLFLDLDSYKELLQAWLLESLKRPGVKAAIDSIALKL